jgi:DNA primase
MSRISEATIQELDARADALAIVGDYVRLDKRAGRYWGLCPFHNEKSPSFSVEPDKKFFYCFGCGKGGGMVNFVMEMEKLSYPETLELLAKKLGVVVQYEGGRAEPRDEGAADRKAALAELFDRVAGSFHHILLNTDQAAFVRAYLADRAIGVEAIERFRLGYAPADRSWLYGFLAKHGYSPEFLAGSGLFSKDYPRTAFFRDRLMFPIRDRQGKAIAFGARLLRGEGPKYLNSGESPLFKKSENLFALDLALPAIRQEKTAYLCEGYVDAIALHQAGIGAAVAPLGTAFTEDQAKLLKRWAEKVVLVLDSDEAGQNATVKAIHLCRRVALACAVVPIVGGKDPADIYRDAGAEALQKTVKCSINDFDYLIDRAKARFDMEDSEGKAKAVAFLYPYWEAFESEVSKDACVGAIADAFGVDRGSVSADYARGGTRRTEIGPKTPEAIRTDLKMNPELFLFIAAVVHRELFPKVRAAVTASDVTDPAAKSLFIALEECYRNDAADMDSLLARLPDAGLRAFVLERSLSDAFRQSGAKIVDDGIKRLKRGMLERRRGEAIIKLRVARHAAADAPTAVEDILAEVMHIDTELARLKDDNA